MGTQVISLLLTDYKDCLNYTFTIIYLIIYFVNTNHSEFFNDDFLKICLPSVFNIKFPFIIAYKFNLTAFINT
jgi:hypothetical protein